MSVKKYIILIFLSFLLSSFGFFSIVFLTSPDDRFGNLNKVFFFLSFLFSLVSILTLIIYFLSIFFTKNKIFIKYFDLLEVSFKRSFFITLGIIIFLIFRMIKIFGFYIPFTLLILVVLFGEILIRLKIKRNESKFL